MNFELIEGVALILNFEFINFELIEGVALILNLLILNFELELASSLFPLLRLLRLLRCYGTHQGTL